MSEFAAIEIYILSAVIAAASQVILKWAAMKPTHHSSRLKYADARIILAYLMLITTLVMNTFAMRYLPYKYIPVLSSVSYIFVLLFGKLFFHEKTGKRRIIGVLIIFTGMLLFRTG